VVGRHAAIDILFVNAGRPLLAPIDVMLGQDLDHMLKVNLKGPGLMLRAASPHLRPGARCSSTPPQPTFRQALG
jgi:NAD(P)-dependent dehydrogenase (short-subunit alcohol dehydrogenase family)